MSEAKKKKNKATEPIEENKECTVDEKEECTVENKKDKKKCAVENKEANNVTSDTEVEEKSDKQETVSENETDWQERYLRLAAEYENYRRRTKEDIGNLYKEASCAIVSELLPLLDSFDSALSVDIEDEDKLNLSESEGIKLLYKQLMSALDKIGVQEIEALGKEFDPALHQAVMSVEDENAGENEIVEVFQKGYRSGDRIIRHSMVKVAN